MKVKVISRNPDDYIRETKKDIHKVQRNFDPSLHPFATSREYVRALNAVKIEKIFAKPFLGSLDGHRDGIQCLAKNPLSLSSLISGSCDGEIRIWNLINRDCMKIIPAHSGIVRGLCYTNDGNRFLSVSDDKTVKIWNGCSDTDTPLHTIIGKRIMTGIDHHRKNNQFATCGETVDLWEETRSEPLRSYTWGVDTLNCVKFNPIETNLLGSTCSDRSIILYDIREVAPVRKVTLEMRSNTICWNPMESFVFTVANEDHNLYSFDLRKLSRASQIHMDHISAVLDVDYSPTGKEIVSGSYDKTIRIFPLTHGRSREIYHTKRMQRLTCVLWSMDNKYILSSSDEMNIRIWKSNASEQLGVLSYREKSAANYSKKLKEKFGQHSQIKRISRHRHIPKHVYNACKEKRVMLNSRKRKEANRRLHSKPGTVPYVSEKEKHIVNESE
ncbi:DDB1- and CUL4-associated factor 13 [Centruroides vittatus]|uniref:DDB1- and CUL4-associated factor 13 n=1 Tax=Centruroides vittatus TaxID=120091 RepID=UPI003510451F